MPDPPVDLRSDTVTRPTPAMRKAIAEAEVGDDMRGEDPTVNRLEARVADMFEMEAAVFAPSATQANQMAVRSHCLPGDELLIDATGHIANFEAGGPAVLSGVTVRALQGRSGLLDVDVLEGRIRADDQHLCPTRLLCLENTANIGGGRAYPIAQLERVSRWGRENGLAVHMDGARLFNALVAHGSAPREIARCIDTLTLCFSKGLGCPVGAILVGPRDTISRARRARKLFGGALRQAGIVAAAAIHALENHVERLAEDHENARFLARRIAGIDGLSVDPAEVETNLVYFEIDPQRGTAAELSDALLQRGIGIGAVGRQRLRACTHLDVSREQVVQAADLIGDYLATGLAGSNGTAAGPYVGG